MVLLHALVAVASVLGIVGTASLQQAPYFDGDSDAHTKHVFRALTHTPKHPFAVAARRRGLGCLVASGVVMAAALALHEAG